ncbi:MAG: hypothetical protein B6D41_11845 [Chloroflexi bacterium UTCFX4]|jgi:hypothetical protein|nr:MAG: hypothetical protein B6D41_11845 [Chloroflexi bacterium UTCFX4]
MTSKRITTRTSKTCKAKNGRGEPCAAHAGADGYCAFHSPAHGKARAEGHKRGGERNRVPHGGGAEGLPKRIRTLTDVLAVLDYALAETLPMENSIQRGRLLVALAHAFVEAIKTGELEARVEAIENALKARGEVKA